MNSLEIIKLHIHASMWLIDWVWGRKNSFREQQLKHSQRRLCSYFSNFSFLCVSLTHIDVVLKKCYAECGVNKKIALEPIFSLFRALAWSRDAWIFCRECALSLIFFILLSFFTLYFSSSIPSFRIHKRFRQEKK